MDKLFLQREVSTAWNIEHVELSGQLFVVLIAVVRLIVAKLANLKNVLGGR